MSKWQIIERNLLGAEIILKEYPFKIQAVMWCFMHGYVKAGGYGSGRFYTLDPRVKIKEVKK